MFYQFDADRFGEQVTEARQFVVFDAFFGVKRVFSKQILQATVCVPNLDRSNNLWTSFSRFMRNPLDELVWKQIHAKSVRLADALKSTIVRRRRMEAKRSLEQQQPTAENFLEKRQK